MKMQRGSIKNDEAAEEMVSRLSGFDDELRDTFYSNNKKNVFHVRLTAFGLHLQRETPTASTSKDHLLRICDIIGGRCVRLQKQTTRFKRGTCGICSPHLSEENNCQSENVDAYMYVFAYVLKKNIRNVLRRERTVITLRFRSFDSYDDNMQEADKWCRALRSHRDHYLWKSSSIINCKVLPMRRLLILLNPKSGSGKARDFFHQQVVPIFNEAEVPYDLYVTKHSNYAYEFIRRRDLSMWTGIAAIGGDGLFHEILNGLLKRLDWESIISNIMLGIVPCGSGNGLARSIAHCYDEPYDPKPILGAALTLVNGHSTTMDVVEIEMDSKIMYSFLSVGWGLISDIDIESERLRPLGYQRFTIWTLHRLINLRTYRGSISYMPKIESFAETESIHSQDPINQTSLQHSLSCTVFSNSDPIKKYKSNDHISDTDFEDVISLETLANLSFRSRCGSWLSSGSRKSTYYSIAESIYHSVSDNSECNDRISPLIAEGSNDLQYIRLSEKKLLPDQTLSDKWVVEDGEFVMVHAAYQTHLGSDCHFAPQSNLNDGTIYLVIIRGGISKSQLLTFLINMSTGTHLPSQNTQFIQVVRVEAFRLEPYQNKGIITVDGERVKCGPLQAKIIPRAIHVMTPKSDAFSHTSLKHANQ